MFDFQHRNIVPRRPTSSFSVRPSDTIILPDASSGAITATLFGVPRDMRDFTLFFQQTGNTSNAVTIRDASGSVVATLVGQNSTALLQLAPDTGTWLVAHDAFLMPATAGTVEANKVVVPDSNKDIGDFRNLDAVNVDAGLSGAAGSVDIFPSTASKGKVSFTATDNAGNTTTSITNRSAAGARTFTYPDPGASADLDMLVGTVSGVGAATSKNQLLIKKTGIADNTATDILTVTVPNANAAAAIRILLVASLGTGTDTFESTRVAQGLVVLARQAGANVVGTAVALTNAGIATVSGGGTLTLAYSLGSVSGAVGATNTFTVQVTLVKTGTITDLQCVAFVELINAETGGVTVSAA